MVDYLTEQKLVDFCKENFSQHEMRFNKKLIEIKDYNFRPDIYIPSIRLVVEFDGYQHYTKSTIVMLDQIKDEICNLHGIDVIRIPYFVQLADNSIFHYFSNYIVDSFNYEQTYPHGFIDKKAILPADFCPRGVDRFIKELQDMPNSLRREIISSMQNRVGGLYEWETVFPSYELYKAGVG